MITEERKTELLDATLEYISELSNGEELYHTLHDCIGITNEELMECGMDYLLRCFQYEWGDGSPQRQYAQLLDELLPQRHDVYTTSAWIRFAEELADGMETSFEQEASALTAAFQEIAGRFSPQVVTLVYQTIHAHDNVLLANEIPLAAEAAEHGATVQELADMAAAGKFEGGPAPSMSM